MNLSCLPSALLRLTTLACLQWAFAGALFAAGVFDTPLKRADLDAAARICNESNDGTWGTWDNGKEGAEQPVSPERPEWLLLTWPQPVTLCGLNALWAGCGTAQVQAFTGPAAVHPREAPESAWTAVGTFANLDSQYPRALGNNWMPFPAPVTTRALRVQMTAVTREGHPHLTGNTKGGKRVWLGELLALAPLQDAPLETTVLPMAGDLGPPPHSHPLHAQRGGLCDAGHRDR